jgi:mono/diheme cytochrome c family protein
MAKAKGKAEARPKAPRQPPPPQPPPEPVPAPAVPAEDRGSRRAGLLTAAVVAASIAATFLLLSGWTPGPGQPGPARVATSPASAPKPASRKKTKKKAVKPARAVPLTTRQISRQLFQDECGVCHTLAAAGTLGLAGPNLDKLRPTRQRVLDAIAVGGRGTGSMPPAILTGRDALNVAKFVSEAARR